MGSDPTRAVRSCGVTQTEVLATYSMLQETVLQPRTLQCSQKREIPTVLS